MASSPYIDFSNVFNPSDFTIADGSLSLATADQRYVKIGSFGTLSALTVSGSIDCGSLTVDGSPVASAPDYIVGITPGTAAVSKALVLDSDRRIKGIQSLCIGSSADTNRQLSILKDDLEIGGQLFSFCYGVTNALNDQSEFCFGYTGPGSTSNSLSLGFYANPGILKVEASQSVDIPFHNGTTKGLKLGGVLITAAASELNYVDTTAGTAQASKALVLNSSRDIANINELIAAKLSGVIQTASQPLITSIGTLSSLSVSGGITGTLQTTAQPLITSVGTLSSLNVSGGITGTLQTASQPLITSVGTLSSLNVSGGITGTLQTASQPLITSLGTQTSINSIEYRLNGSLIDFDSFTAESVYLSGVSPGTASASKALVLNSSRDISNINQISSNVSIATLFRCTNLDSAGRSTIDFRNDLRTLELGLRGSTMDQPDTFYIYSSGAYHLVIESNGNCSIGGIESGGYKLNVAGSINGTSLSIGGTLITATAAEINYLDITAIGTAEASKALVVDANRDISNLNSLTALNLTGTLQTAAQPQITSVGTLTSLTITNGLTAATLSGTLQTATQPQITSLGTLTSLTITNGLTAATLSGTLQTATQPQITSVGTLTSLTITNGLTAATLSGTLQTAAQPQITSLGTLSSLNVSGAISASQLTGTLQTAAQPLITSLGNLTSLTISGALNATLATSAQPSITSVGTLTSLTTHALTVGNGTTNELRFGGVSGDAGSDMSVIANRLYGASDFAEMILFQGNDQQGASGPDRIRHRAGGHIWQTFLGDETYSTMSDNNDRMVINNNGDVYVAKKLIVSGEGIDTASLSIGGTLVSSSADELSYNNITTLGAFEPSKTMTLDGSGVGKFGLGTRTSNCLQFYGGTAFKETLSIYRESDDSGLTIALTPVTIQKSTPLLTLLSGNGLNSGTHAAAKIEILKSVITNTRMIGLDVYTAGLFTAYDQGTPPWLSSGFGQYSQLYTSQGAFNIACGTSDVSTYASSSNLLLTAAGQVCINTATPVGNYSLTVNKSTTKAGVAINGNATILKLQNSGGSTTDRTSFEMSHNTSWEISLGGSAHAVAPDSLYWYNSGYRMCLTPTGRLGINTAAPFCPLVVNGNASLTITDIATNTYRYNVSSGSWSNLGGGPQVFALSAYFTSNIYVQNSVYTSSDRRLKTDIKPLDISLDHYKSIKPVSYRMKDELKTKLGFIAQDMLEVASEVVEIGKNDELEGGYQYNIDYSQMTAINASVIKKLIERVEALEMR